MVILSPVVRLNIVLLCVSQHVIYMSFESFVVSVCPIAIFILSHILLCAAHYSHLFLIYLTFQLISLSLGSIMLLFEELDLHGSCSVSA